jgi:hypothetical protein
MPDLGSSPQGTQTRTGRVQQDLVEGLSSERWILCIGNNPLHMVHIGRSTLCSHETPHMDVRGDYETCRTDSVSDRARLSARRSCKVSDDVTGVDIKRVCDGDGRRIDDVDQTPVHKAPNRIVMDDISPASDVGTPAAFDTVTRSDTRICRLVRGFHERACSVTEYILEAVVQP